MDSAVLSDQATKIGFLVTPGFPILTLSAALEPLRMANDIIGLEVFAWHLLTEDGNPVESSSRVLITPDSAMDAAQDIDMLFVVGGLWLTTEKRPALQNQLRRLARRGVTIGALSSGVFALARAGLLDKNKCAVHWYVRNAFQELFPDLELSSKLFEISDGRITCAGGTASLDMMLALMSPTLSASVRHEISTWIHYPKIRDRFDEQGGAELGPMSVSSPRVAQAISIFRRNIEYPLQMHDVAARIGVSVRQLERLFRAQFGNTPTVVYRQIRLLQARELIQYTSMRLTDIALATGFQSYSHFSRCYLQQFGSRPGRNTQSAE